MVELKGQLTPGISSQVVQALDGSSRRESCPTSHRRQRAPSESSSKPLSQTQCLSVRTSPYGQLPVCNGRSLSDVENVSPTPGVGTHRSDQPHPALVHGVHEPTATSPCTLST
eukprot:7391455-Prymnesium_polylepis.2